MQDDHLLEDGAASRTGRRSLSGLMVAAGLYDRRMEANWGGDSDALLSSVYYSPAETSALGRMVELSAWLEELMRTALGRALDLEEEVADAAFLGDSASSLHERLQAIAEVVIYGRRERWLPDAVHWADQVSQAIARRNHFAHRAPIMVDTDNGPASALLPARRRQKTEVLAVEDMLQTVETLSRLVDVGSTNLFGNGNHEDDDEAPAWS